MLPQGSLEGIREVNQNGGGAVQGVGRGVRIGVVRVEIQAED